jgi:hypothetical protein
VVKRLLIGSIPFLAGVLASQAAFAQAPPKTTIHVYRGLFGPTELEENLPERLFFTFSTYGAGDDSSALGGTDIADVTLQARRFYQGAQARFSMRRQRARSLINFEGTSALRYYPGLHGVTTSQHGGSLDAQLVRSPKLKFQLSAAGAYSPYYQFQPGQASVAGPVPAPGQDFSVARQRTLNYGGLGAMTYSAGRYTEFVVNGGARYTQFLDAPDFISHSLGARVTHRVSRDFALVLGYSTGLQGRSGLPGTRTQNIDAGLNYAHGVWLSPKTSIGFSTGSAIVSALDGKHFELTGSAFVKQQLSPRWTAQVAVARGIQAVETSPRPFIGETINASLGGYFSRRLSLRLTPMFGHGTDVTVNGGSYRSFSNQARVEWAFSRFWAFYVEHYYFHYRTAGPELPSELPGLDRQGARTGITLWAPMVR